MTATQWSCSLDLRGARFDSRMIRRDLVLEGVLTRDQALQLSCYGHRQSFNLTAITPAGNELADLAPKIGGFLAKRYETFIPMNLRAQDIDATPVGAPTAYTVHSLVLAKGGKDWKRFDDSAACLNVARERITSGIASCAKAWGIELPPIELEHLLVSERVAAKAMMIDGNNAGVLLVREISFRVRCEFAGLWSFGPLMSLGFGRLSQIHAQVPLMSPEQQMEALA